jgi:RHS repeat-associated protein
MPVVFLHLSDIHFGQEKGGRVFTHEDVRERLLDDVALLDGQTLVSGFVKLPGGARAVYNSGGLAYFRRSSRLSTAPSRTKYYDVAYTPYGQDYDGSGTTQDLAFTDQNQDTEAGGSSNNLYDFMFREYRTAHGRWTSPDPAGLGAVDPTNPQTWNRYACVINNPLSLVDPLGLEDDCGGPCVPFWEPVGGGCFEYIYYTTLTSPDGINYDWPVFGPIQCGYTSTGPTGVPLPPSGPPSSPGGGGGGSPNMGPCVADCTLVANGMKKVITVPLGQVQQYIKCVERGAAYGALTGTLKAAATWAFGPPGWAANIVGSAAGTGGAAALVCAGY